MIESLDSIEWDASRRSFVHDLDARVKIIIVFLMIILMVGYPVSSGVYGIAIPYAIIIAGLWALSTLPIRIYLSRLLVTLPFGFTIIFFRIFFNNYQSETATLVQLPFPFIPVYAESVTSGEILLVKFLICISAIILLSSTTPVQEMLKGGKRLGLPPVMALSLGMMIRYLFLFGRMYEQIHYALYGKCFEPFDRKLPHKYRLRTLGYAMGSLFLRSYEQGERTYGAMLARGYGSNMFVQLEKKPLTRMEMTILCSLSVVMIITAAGMFLIHG